jgi:uncharacterized protein YcnI
MFRPIACGMLAVLVCLSPPAVTRASAHVTAHPDTGTAGSSFETEFDVSHGCDGSATVSVSMKIPAEVAFVKPRLKPGWKITIKTRKLDGVPPSSHGRSITETADEVTWRGGPLPNAMYDGFSLRMRLPNQPGATLYFPAIQQCQKGIHRWVEIPGPGQGWTDMREPPPFVKVIPRAT